MFSHLFCGSSLRQPHQTKQLLSNTLQGSKQMFAVELHAYSVHRSPASMDSLYVLFSEMFSFQYESLCISCLSRLNTNVHIASELGHQAGLHTLSRGA